MFGLFTKLSEYVWGASEDENVDASKTGARNKTADYNEKLKTTEPQLKKDLFGKVTRLYDGSETFFVTYPRKRQHLELHQLRFLL